MALDVISDNSREFADLEGEPTILRRRQSQRIFVQPNGGPVIARVESAIKPGLGEKINLRSVLCIEKERETRIEEIVNLAVDQFRRWLLEMVNFKIDCPAQARPQVVVECGDGERAVEPVEKIIDLKRVRAAGQQAKAEGQQRLHTNLTRALHCWLRHAQM